MPRIARKYLESSFFHVIMQGINKEFVFRKDDYKERYLQLIYKYKNEMSTIFCKNLPKFSFKYCWHFMIFSFVFRYFEILIQPISIKYSY